MLLCGPRTRRSAWTTPTARPSSTEGPVADARSRRKPTLAVVGRHRRRRHGDAVDPVHPRGRLGRDPARRLGPLGRHGAARARRGGRGRRRSRPRSSTASTSRCSTCPTRSRPSGRRSRRRAAPSWSTTPARSGWTPRCRSSCPRSTRPRSRNRPKGIIANPNCTTLTMMDALGALHSRWQLTELVVASYQAASGAGQPGVDRLYDELEVVARRPRRSAQRAGDVRRAIGDKLGDDAARRSRRRWRSTSSRTSARAGTTAGPARSSRSATSRARSSGIPDLKVSATCVRVPVVTTHSLAVHAIFAAADRRRRGPAGAGRGAVGRRARTTRTRSADPSSRRRPTSSARTRPSSAGSARRWTSRTRSTCSSAATTCARARR